ncbi:putative polysaccharide biosynthesis protein [Paenibacillus turpanensis]|uniref:putative polysaccharide biosynthesis protein n=1 Tax=Paenibacillus turpanensis TaxID=2689078 RepID=UPI00140B33A9|nr:polysaccharide biosynthesis protein [Paenibacillus turpanensis]
MSKDSLLKGTLVLTLAAFVARFLGVVQRVPLQQLLQDAGMASFGVASNIYLTLLVVATAGIPSTLSKMVSERYAVGRIDEAERVFRAAVWFSLAAGVVASVGLYAAAPFYAVHISHTPDAVWAIRALAPALLFFPLVAILRGYFQGRQQMVSNGISQIIEQILRVGSAVLLAYVLLELGTSMEWAVAGASFGGVIGAIAALAVMGIAWLRLKRRDRQESGAPADAAGTAEVVPTGGTSTAVSAVDQSLAARKQGETAGNTSGTDPQRLRGIYKQMLAYGVPIAIISTMVNLVYLIDSSSIVALLKSQMEQLKAIEILGILTARAQSIAGIPVILAIAISQSIVPIVSAAHARGDRPEVERQASMALRLGVLSGLPLVLFFALAAHPLNGLIFTDTEGSLTISGLTVSAMFQIVMLTSSAILMGMGIVRAQVVFVAIGLVVKLVGNFALVPLFGVQGAIVSTALAFIVTMTLNLRAMRKQAQVRFFDRKRWAGLLSVIAIISAAGIGLQQLLQKHVMFGAEGWALRGSYALHCVLIGMLTVILYAALLALFRVVTADELRRMPGPLRKLANRLDRKSKKQQVQS